VKRWPTSEYGCIVEEEKPEKRWPTLEGGCIVEEEKLDEPFPYDWLSFYQWETAEDTEEEIQKMEDEIVKDVEADQGTRVTLEPLWITCTMLARTLREHKIFGRIVKEAFQAWRDEEQCRMSIMEEIEGIAESPWSNQQPEEHSRNTQKKDEAKGDSDQSEEQKV